MGLSPIVEALQRRLLRVDGGGVLNRLSLEPLPPPEPELAEALRRAALTMEAQAFDPATGLLDYARLAGSASLQAYRQQERALWAFDPSVLETPSQRLAFWINLYNALMVDAVISFEVRRTVREIPGIFWRAAYSVGGAVTHWTTSSMAFCDRIPVTQRFLASASLWPTRGGS
jgi:hypothetical protein